MKYLNVNKLIKDLKTKIRLVDEDIEYTLDNLEKLNENQNYKDLITYIEKKSTYTDALKYALLLIEKYSFDENDYK